MGYDPADVLNSIAPYLGTVHIKDRLLDGDSVPLGEGAVDFSKVFSILNEINFSGYFSFQAYRDKNSNNTELLSLYQKFIYKIMKQNRILN